MTRTRLTQRKGMAADLSRRYMPHYQVTSVVIVPLDLTLEESSVQLARALLQSPALPLERAEDRYVVRTGVPPSTTVELPRSLTEPLDSEYAAHASWAIVQLSPRAHGRLKVVLRRIEHRHGFLSTYQNDGCRCDDCTAANADASFAYRRQASPPKAKSPRKHGAQCWKFGCYCEERRAADRLRQERHRAKVAAMRER